VDLWRIQGGRLAPTGRSFTLSRDRLHRRGISSEEVMALEITDPDLLPRGSKVFFMPRRAKEDLYIVEQDGRLAVRRLSEIKAPAFGVWEPVP